MKCSIKKACVLTLSVCALLLSGCSKPYEYDYPKDLSAEECLVNYEYFDPNIIYTQCYEFLGKCVSSPGTLAFAAIKDNATLDFMVLYREIILLGEAHEINLVRKKGVEDDPVWNYTPSKVEFCWYDLLYREGPKKDTEAFYNFERAAFETIQAITDADAIEEIMSAARHDVFITYEDYNKIKTPEMKTYQYIYEDDPPKMREYQYMYSEDHRVLCIKVTFKECQGIALMGILGVDEKGNTYMYHGMIIHPASETDAKEPASGSPAITTVPYRLGESMDSILKSINFIHTEK